MSPKNNLCRAPRIVSVSTFAHLTRTTKPVLTILRTATAMIGEKTTRVQLERRYHGASLISAEFICPLTRNVYSRKIWKSCKTRIIYFACKYPLWNSSDTLTSPNL